MPESLNLKVNEVKTASNPKQWAVFERQRLIHKHIDENGMVNPIVVDSEGNLQFGGCRLQYAVLNNWEEIPAIVINDIEEVRKKQIEMASFEYTFLPEQYIEIKRS